MASLYIAKWQQFHDDSGDPLNGGLLYFYLTTTTTARNTYPTEADAIAGTNANANPITLDADGRSPVEVWLSGRYRLIVKDSALVTISDDDPIEDFVTASDAQDSSPTYGGNNSGTADALVFTFSPALTAYTNGQVLRGRITADNTGAVTINANGVGIKSLVKRDGRAIRAGDLQGPDIIEFYYDSTTDVFRLGTPVGPNIRTDLAPTAGVVTLTGYTNARITGTDTVTGFTIPDGEACDCVAAAALPITAGASLIFPGVSSGTTITLAAGDTFRVRGEASSVARVHQFTRAASGADGLLSTTTFSGASSADISLPSGYRYYKLLWDLGVNTDGAEIYARVSLAGDATFKSGAAEYEWTADENDVSGAGVGVVGSAGDTQIIVALNVGSAAAEGCDGELTISNPASTTRYKSIRFHTSVWDNTAGSLHKSRTGSGSYNAGTEAIDAIQILPSGGTITGTAKLYGYA